MRSIGVPVALILLLLFTAASTGFVSRHILLNHELDNAGGLIADEAAYLFQARVFLEGRLWADSHPLPEFFDAKFLINDGRMYSQYPPGHPLVLAAGLLLFGHPRHLLLLLAVLIVVYTYLIGHQLHGRRVALLAATLTGISPFFVFTSATLLSHTPDLFFLLGFAFHLTRSMRAPHLAHTAAAGVFLGLAELTRPFTALLVSLPFAVLVLLWLWRRLWPLRHAGVLAAIALSFAALLMGSNQVYNGDPLRFSYTAYSRVPERGSGMNAESPARPLRDAEKPAIPRPVRQLKVLSTQIERVSQWYLGFPLVLVLVLLFPVIRGKSPWDYANLSVLPCLLCGHALYYFFAPIHYTGPVYYYESIPFLSLAMARAYLALQAALPTRVARVTAGTALALLLCTSLLRFGAERALLLRTLVLERTNPQALIREQGLDDAIVFVARRVPYRENYRYTYNSPGFRDGVLRARDLGRRNQELMDFYPGRRAYRYRYDSENGEGELLPLGP